MPKQVLDSGTTGRLPSRPPAPRNAQEAIAAQSNAKRAAANNATPAAPNPTTGRLQYGYGGGPLTQDKGSFNTRSGGNRDAPQLGYTPGGFDDPTIDWQAIYDTFVAPTLNQGEGGGGGYSSGGGSSPDVVTPVAPAVFQPPAVVTAQSVQPPQAISATASSAADAPTGAKFETFGTPSTFGGFERRRNARGPRNTGSMTPEMLRRAAAARLG